MTLICAVLFAFHIISVERYTKRYSHIPLVFYQILTAGILSIPFTIFFETTYCRLSLKVVISLLIAIILSTIFGHFIQNKVQKITTATHTALIFTAEPIFAALVAVAFYGESFDSIKLLGMVSIITWMLTAEFYRTPEKPVSVHMM